jgi:hypothetical protein
MTAIAELRRLAGFPLLLPAYLPTGCVLEEQFFSPGPRTVTFAYSCVSITEQLASGPIEPYVGEGSTETVIIHGRSAVYIDGAWIVAISPNGKEPTEAIWAPRAVKQLIFEYHDTVVIITGDNNLTKDEMLSIAQSIQ